MGCDDEALAAGSNLAVLGSEIVQFGDAIPLGPGRFRLGRLMRGREGTEAVQASHVAGEWFALIEPDALRVIQLPPSAIGSEVSVRAVDAEGDVSEARTTIGEEASRPVRGSVLVLEGSQVVGTRRQPIASPTGGATMDAEARAAIEQVLSAMRLHGLIET